MFLVRQGQLQVTPNLSYPPQSPRTAAPSCCFTIVNKWFPPQGLKWLFMSSHKVHIPVSIQRKAKKRACSPQLRTFPENYTQHFCLYPTDHMGAQCFREAGLCNLIAGSHVLGYNTWGYIIKGDRKDRHCRTISGTQAIGTMRDNVHEALSSLPGT